jgi:hypothetical protein
LVSLDLKKALSTLKGKLAITSVVITLAVCGLDTLHHVSDYRQVDRLPESYAGAAAYLGNTSDENDIVFTGDWDDFPLLYHFNTHNRYIVGLDPHYLFYYDADLSDLWLDITNGRTSDTIVQIRDRFKARYIFSLKKDHRFLIILKATRPLTNPPTKMNLRWFTSFDSPLYMAPSSATLSMPSKVT